MRYQACNTGNKKELFGIRTKLSHTIYIYIERERERGRERK